MHLLNILPPQVSTSNQIWHQGICIGLTCNEVGYGGRKICGTILVGETYETLSEGNPTRMFITGIRDGIVVKYFARYKYSTSSYGLASHYFILDEVLCKKITPSSI